MTPILTTDQVLAYHSGKEAVAYVPIEGVPKGYFLAGEEIIPNKKHNAVFIHQDKDGDITIPCPFTPGKPVKCREEWRVVRYSFSYLLPCPYVVLIEYKEGQRRRFSLKMNEVNYLWFDSCNWQPPHTMPEAFCREYMVKEVGVEEREGKHFWRVGIETL